MKFTQDSKAILNWIFKKDSFIRCLQDSYCGLPELTNANGIFCGGSCPTQAWSAATMIELLNDLEAYDDLVQDC